MATNKSKAKSIQEKNRECVQVVAKRVLKKSGKKIELPCDLVELNALTGTIKTWMTRKATGSGRAMNVTNEKGEMVRQPLPFTAWETTMDRALTGSIHTSVKTSTTSGILSLVALEDIPAGTEIGAFALVTCGETEINRIQDDFNNLNRGSLNATTLAERERVKVFLPALKVARGWWKLFPNEEQIVNALQSEEGMKSQPGSPQAVSEEMALEIMAEVKAQKA